MRAQRERREDDEVEGSVGYERVVAFSDGVFAIAITLLVLSIEVPDVPSGRLGDALGDLAPQLVSYFIGFGVIGLFWLGHHEFFNSLREFDRAMLLLNLAFLAFISLMPFTTALFGRYGDVSEAVILYACSVAAASILDTAMLWLALRRDLIAPSAVGTPRARVAASLLPAAIFLISIPVAVVDPDHAPLVWLLLFLLTRVRRWAQRSPGAPLS